MKPKVKDLLAEIAGRMSELEPISSFDGLVRNLRVGLLCLKAHDLTAILDPGDRSTWFARQGAGGSFKGWLKETVPWLSTSAAYDYMGAVKGLGIDHAQDFEAVSLALARAIWSAAEQSEPLPSIESLKKKANRRAL